MRAAPLLAAALGAALAAPLAGAADLKAGRAVYEAVCIACHAPENVMVAAPKRGDAAEWQRRLARSPKGLDTLTAHAVEGFNAMPPRGGASALTAQQVRQAIAYMMAK